MAPLGAENLPELIIDQFLKEPVQITEQDGKPKNEEIEKITQQVKVSMTGNVATKTVTVVFKLKTGSEVKVVKVITKTYNL